MSGVNGAVKLNITTPKKVAETEKPVSAIVVQEKEEKQPEIVKEQPKVVELEVKEDKKPSPSIEDVFIFEEVKVKEPTVKVKQSAYNATKILDAYAKIEGHIKSLYDNVFSKTQNFKPTYPQTVADTFNYIYSLLKSKGYSSAFEKAFGLVNIEPKTFDIGYIPYSIKLSKWAEDKGLIVVCESLLSAITELYYESATEALINLTEDELTSTFQYIINYAL